jgi:lipid-binding SYLF domain-containing protein
MKRFAKIFINTALAGLALSWAGLASAAMSTVEIDSGVQSTLQAFYAQHNSNHELVDKAAAVLVFPKITKAGVGVGGLHGEGALIVGGKTVKYYDVNGASVGATLGVSEHSEVILFMTKKARDDFENSKGWTIGADAGVAVASAGVGGNYDTETLKRPVLSFVLDEKGLMGDLSLSGQKVTPKSN